MSRRQIPLRIPTALDVRVREAAERSGLSINATILAALEQAFGRFRLDEIPPESEGEKP
jgi:hypothetical protein